MQKSAAMPEAISAKGTPWLNWCQTSRAVLFKRKKP
jgi:hypothetical protein